MLPATYVIGSNMSDNFSRWGARRISEINESSMPNKGEEVRKVEERVAKFSDRMIFVKELKGLVEQATSL
jgi:hypothetical protein